MDMSRDLARMTAQLKGPRYEGALIGRIIWERRPGDTGGKMQVLRDQHGLLEVAAADLSGRLTLVMMLGHAAPARSGKGSHKERPLTLRVDGPLPEGPLSFSFSAEEVHDFVRAVGDTNSLHTGEEPVVPGLLIFETALRHPALAGVSRAEMRFHGAFFAGETVEIRLQSLSGK